MTLFRRLASRRDDLSPAQGVLVTLLGSVLAWGVVGLLVAGGMVLSRRWPW